MKLKNTLIALLMIIGSTLMAQEKYEQAIVKQLGQGLFITLEGKETTFEKNTVKTSTGIDFSFLLSKVAELRNDGWEVWNTTSGDNSNVVTYFLHRKLK